MGSHSEGYQAMRIPALSFASIALALTINASTAPQASAQYCEGTVRGLSSHYNPHTGAGFLAVRTAPRKSAHQVGELFNGDTVEVFDRRGNWYRVAATDGSSDGWASTRWIRNDCDY
jgi:hypothetical protein